MQKFLFSLMATILLFSTFGLSGNVKAAETDKISELEIEEITGTSLEGYNYIEYDEPITVNHDGTEEVLLGYFEETPLPVLPSETPRPIGYQMDGPVEATDYREYNKWYVYDQGITKSWSYLSNPYFVKSIARGMTYEKTTEVSATISGTFSSEIPSASLPTVKNSFGFNTSGSKKITQKITLSGPGSGYSSRDFYYKKGRHTHKVKIVQERRSNWDGLLWKKTFYGSVGKPAIKHYSVDRK